MTRPQDSILHRLLNAVINDDHPRAKTLLHQHPHLATSRLTKPKLFNADIVHWLYANDTALHLAAAGHRVAIARRLLAAGADPNAAHNHRLGRPLHYAADGHQSPSFDPRRQVQMIRLLLKAGAAIHAPDKNGATALHRAVRTRSAAAVDCLLRAGADPMARNHSGAAPLHLAVQNTGRGGTGTPVAKTAQQKIIQSLLSHGADPHIPDAHGRSVLDWATNEKIRQWLG